MVDKKEESGGDDENVLVLTGGIIGHSSLMVRRSDML